jgi:hypothetical protein
VGRELRAFNTLLSGAYKQESNEVVALYHSRVLLLMKEAQIPKGFQQVQYFQQGLIKALKDKCVTDEKGNLFPSLEAAYQHAMGVERTVNARKLHTTETPSLFPVFQQHKKAKKARDATHKANAKEHYGDKWMNPKQLANQRAQSNLLKNLTQSGFMTQQAAAQAAQQLGIGGGGRQQSGWGGQQQQHMQQQVMPSMGYGVPPGMMLVPAPQPFPGSFHPGSGWAPQQGGGNRGGWRGGRNGGGRNGGGRYGGGRNGGGRGGSPNGRFGRGNKGVYALQQTTSDVDHNDQPPHPPPITLSFDPNAGDDFAQQQE